VAESARDFTKTKIDKNNFEKAADSILGLLMKDRELEQIEKRV